MKTVSWAFHFRWLYWALGGSFILALIFGFPKRSLYLMKEWNEVHFKPILIFFCVAYFFLAALSKWTQLEALLLHGQDFWLFVDILEQMKSGGVFLTRFAPHSTGFVQHGTVHPMLTWGFLYPFAQWIGSVPSALCFGPAMIALAAFFLALLARGTWGGIGALFFSFAFLISTQVGKILNYEVHPETAYPFFVLFWFWSVGLDGSQKVRWISLILASVLGMGIKEDSFLIFGPWIIWGLYSLPRGSSQRRAVALSALLCASVFIFQIYAVRQWVSGIWGPHIWDQTEVIYKAGVSFFKGTHWSDLESIQLIMRQILEEKGGVLRILNLVLQFLVSRPWLSLLVLAPWVIFQKKFWWAILPLATVYSVLEGPNHLWNYYAAPFLGSFWFCAIYTVSKKSTFLKPFWAFCAACFLGSSNLTFFYPSLLARQFKEQTQFYARCLTHQGIVPSHLIPWVPLEKVWTDRIPGSLTHWEKIDFVLLSPNFGSYELPLDRMRQLDDQLSKDHHWTQVNFDCMPIMSPQIESESEEFKPVVKLFIRN